MDYKMPFSLEGITDSTVVHGKISQPVLLTESCVEGDTVATGLVCRREEPVWLLSLNTYYSDVSVLIYEVPSAQPQ